MSHPRGSEVSAQATAHGAAASSEPTESTVAGVVGEKVNRIQSDAMSRRAYKQARGVAALARLRRGAGKHAGSVNDILEFTLDSRLVGPGSGDEATAAEIAAHVSLTLYAVHQQSQRDRMHRSGRGLGAAVAKLKHDDTSDTDPILRRFQVMGSATGIYDLAYHARGMVQLLRTNQVPLDYARLAGQLLRWQRPGGPEDVRLVWGRDFYRPRKPESD